MGTPGWGGPRSIAARYGIADIIARTETDRLPAGLENSAVCLSLDAFATRAALMNSTAN
eukprot:COSAG02_NODE_2704_length_8197_cov_2.646085_3_plen_59_part_00